MGIAGGDTPNYVISLFNSGQVYGAEYIGASPSQVKKRRRHAHRNMLEAQLVDRLLSLLLCPERRLAALTMNTPYVGTDRRSCGQVVGSMGTKGMDFTDVGGCV